MLPLGLLLAGIVFLTGDGRVELTVNSPDVEVTIDGETKQIEVISETNGRYVIAVQSAAGRHKLQVTHDGFTTLTDHFWLTRGGKREFEALLTPPAAMEKATETAKAPVEPSLSPASRWDSLDPAAIPEAERIPQLPPEVVAVAGSHRQRHWMGVNDVAIRPDGRQAATAASDGIRFWDLETFKQTAWLNPRDPGIDDVWALTYTANGEQLIAAKQSEWTTTHLSVIDCTQELPEVVQALPIPRSETRNWRSLSISHSGQWLAAYGDTGAGKPTGSGDIWKKGDKLHEAGRFSVKSYGTRYVDPWSFSPDEHWVALAGFEDGRVELYALDGDGLSPGPVIRPVTTAGESEPNAPFRSAHSAPDGRLALADTRSRLWFYDVSGEEPRLLFRAPSPVGKFCFSADSSTLLTMRSFDTSREFDVWSLGAEEVTHRLTNDPSPAGTVELLTDHIQHLDVSPDGKLAITGYTNGAVCFWDVSGEALKEHDPIQPNPVVEVWSALTRLPESIGVQTETGQAIRISPSDQGLRSQSLFLQQSDREKTPLAATSDGRLLVTQDTGGRAIIHEHDGQDWRPVQGVDSASARVIAAALSSSQKLLATGTATPATIDLWDLAQKRPVRLVHLVVEEAGYAKQLAFAAEDQVLIARVGTSLKVWRISDQSLHEIEENPVGYVLEFDVSPDGDELATANGYGNANLWSVTEDGLKHRQNVFSRKRWNAECVSYSPDGKRLALGVRQSQAGSVVVRNLQTGLIEHEIPLPATAHRVLYLDDSRHVLTANHNHTLYVLRPQ